MQNQSIQALLNLTFFVLASKHKVEIAF